MENCEIAGVFSQLADLLEIDGANAFRVRSYRNVARTIEGLAIPLTSLRDDGELTSIPGIGKGTAGKIEELLDTGELAAVQQLRDKFPSGLLDMLEIPGFGPKKVALVYNELQIESVNELAAAAEAEQLRELPGMGAKSEQNVLRGIELFREGRERRLLGHALPLGEAIASQVADVPGVTQVSLAGSTRRGQENVGDLDVLAAARKGSKVTQVFQELPEMDEVIAAGDTKVSCYLTDGTQIDLRVVPSKSFGAAQQYFTGSKAHNIALRQRAIQRGLKLNEYGVFQEATDKQIAGATEEDVYAALELPWIPPELREDLGEIEAAEAGGLPDLLDMDDIRGDLHMHTTWSDAVASIEDMVEGCRARGYEYMAITEHSQSLTVASGLSPTELEGQIGIVRGLSEQYDDIEILIGTEVDIKGDGSLDYPDELLDELDVVIAALHQGFSSDADRMTSRMVAAMETGRVHIISHPTGRLIAKRAPYGLHMERVIETAAATDTALEVNAYPERLDLNDAHCRLAKEAGVRLALCTDAHSVAMLDNMRFAVLTARRGWVEAGDVINTMPLQKLTEWLRTRK
ncbi:MAG: DNA polymerase/3'-5' exonuclease PolX [Armatimonadota bacterium]|jgi:DNA polymerase (family 10)